MSEPQGKYNIKAVSNLLGIHSGTLRAWERRYKIIEPVRNEAGHRLYSEDHIRILKWIVNKVDNGFTIGQAVDLLNNKDEPAFIEPDPRITDQMEILKEKLLHELLQFNEKDSNELIDRAFGLFSTDKVLIRILGGILAEVGTRWEKGLITTAHEHFVTSLIRTRIGMVFHTLPINSFLPKAVCVCGPDENHEIGLLIFTYFLKKRGYETIYLGAGIPEKDFYKVVSDVGAGFAIVSTTLAENLPKTLEMAESLAAHNEGVKIGLGGKALNYMKEADKNKFRKMLIGETEEDWSTWLKEQ
jgi:MerR family transcriptional regulator, light-induced transcriptional regulator